MNEQAAAQNKALPIYSLSSAAKAEKRGLGELCPQFHFFVSKKPTLKHTFLFAHGCGAISEQRYSLEWILFNTGIICAIAAKHSIAAVAFWQKYNFIFSGGGEACHVS